MTYFYKDQRLAGMGQFEATLFTKFLEANENKYLNIIYNFRLQRPLNIPKNFPEKYKELALSSTSYRIDAILEEKSILHIVEVRPDAKHSAVGTLIMYKFLYQLQENPTKQVVMMLITNTFNPAMEFTCRQTGIQYIVY